MKSIQGRLTVYMVAGTALLLLAVGLILDIQLSKQFDREFNRSLLAKALTMVTLAKQDNGEVEFDLVEELAPEFKPGVRPEYLQLMFQDGTVLRKSSSLGEADLRVSAASLDHPSFEDLTLPDGRPGRMVTFKFVPIDDSGSDEDDGESGDKESDDNLGIESSDNSSSSAGLDDDREENSSQDSGSVYSADDGSEDLDNVSSEDDSKDATITDPDRQILIDLALAQGRESLDGLLVTMRTTLLLAFVPLMALLAVLARFSIHVGLKSLRLMAREVGSISANNLHKRLTPETASKELDPITNRLNDLLARLEDSFEREKRFSGNVAHELRTPIAELRTLAEVGRQWPTEREMVEGFFGDLIDLADDMETTVVNLLLLARLDAGTQEVTQESFDLAELIDTICVKLQEQVKEKKIRLDNRITRTLHVMTDKDKLKLILINIIYNAVAYSPSGSVVVIDAPDSDSFVELAVSNEAVGLSDQDLSMMFERFWRQDQVRTTGNHAGLGLSLVKALADLLNLEIKPSLHDGSRFTLSLSGLVPAM
jgi:signal transduction histidine kinase